MDIYGHPSTLRDLYMNGPCVCRPVARQNAALPQGSIIRFSSSRHA